MNKKKQGKYEYDFTEVFFENKNNEDWTESKKKLTNFLSLLDQGISFNNLAEKYGYGLETNQKSLSNWIIEDNLEEKLNQTLSKMEIGQISQGIKVDGGYKIFKLNKKEYLVTKNLNIHLSKFLLYDIEELDFSKFLQ